MATFDRSPFSEEILPLLTTIAALPGAEFVLFSVAVEPHGRSASESVPPARAVGLTGQASQPMIVSQAEPQIVENKEQAVERRLADARDYLATIGSKLPAGTKFDVLADLDHDPATSIIRAAEHEQPAVIVMATHGRSGLVHALVGSVAEKVVRSGVAPVLLVRPKTIEEKRKVD
jgi:nucleotide-binding universal stress UspA family protein